MRKKTFTLSEIRDVITDLPQQFEQDPEIVNVTRHGKPIMTILPAESYRELLKMLETLQETLEIIQDEELMAAFCRGVKHMEEGRVKPLYDVLKEPGWE